MKKITIKEINKIKILLIILIGIIFFCDGVKNYNANKSINSEIAIEYLSDEEIQLLTDEPQVVTSNSKTLDVVKEIQKVNINNASIQDLQLLKGIGPSKAAGIITYREEYGLFTSIEEIVEVKGIGDGTYSKIKDFITID